MSLDDPRMREYEGPWVDCWSCGGSGVHEGDCICMDDTCCCLYPEPPVCDVCHGDGGWSLGEAEK